MTETDDRSDGDWSATTFAGLRLRQQREFLALPLREKLARVEEANELVAFFAERRAARSRAARESVRSAPLPGAKNPA